MASTRAKSRETLHDDADGSCSADDGFGLAYAECDSTSERRNVACGGSVSEQKDLACGSTGEPRSLACGNATGVRPEWKTERLGQGAELRKRPVPSACIFGIFNRTPASEAGDAVFGDVTSARQGVTAARPR